MADTHTVMPKKLAQALMDAGVQHFDGGGDVQEGFQKYYSDPLFGWMGRLGNPGQSSYNAGAPAIDTQTFGPRIGQLQGQQNDVYAQQQNLANALLAQSQGQGPNPAQAMLAQNTGNNVQQQAALMASQRGAGANPAMIARQAAMQGANIQQQGVGQAATLQAQQQLQAQQALAQQQAQMANQATQQESIQQGGLAAQNSARTSGSLGMQQINAQTAQGNASTMAGLLGGGLGGIAGAFAMSEGGEVPKYAVGGQVNDNIGIASFQAPPTMSLPGALNNASAVGQSVQSGFGLGKKVGGSDMFKGLFSSPGSSGGGGYGGYSESMSGWNQGPDTMMAAVGGSVPGQAEVSGNSEENDKVPALLSPGEIVLPRSVTQSPDPEKKAIEFLRHLKIKKGGYGAVAKAKKMACGGRVR